MITKIQLNAYIHNGTKIETGSMKEIILHLHTEILAAVKNVIGDY